MEQNWLIHDGTGSVWGDTGWYLVVLGQYGFGISWYLVVLGQYRTVIVGT